MSQQSAQTDRQRRSVPRWWLLGVVAAAVAGVWALTTTTEAAAIPAHTGVVELEQPDGSTFKGRQFGDEWYHGWETRAGHTIVRRQGWWVYAARRADGTLRATDLRVGEDRPTMRKHLRDADRVARAGELRRELARVDAKNAQRAGSPEPSTTGSDPVLVILVQFQNQQNLGTTQAQWASRYFGTGKSLVDFYKKNSYHQFSLGAAFESHGTANGVIGWLTLPMNHPDDRGVERAAIKSAIQAADPYVDYAVFDTNDDGTLSNTELHINVVMAGLEESLSGNDEPEHSIWANRWHLDYNSAPIVDGTRVGNSGFLTYGEKQRKEYEDGSFHTHQATVGVIAHELGHDLGLPDLYDTDDSSAGVGSWSAMSYGSWGFTPSDTDAFPGATPVMFDAWSRWTLGWIAPARTTDVRRTSLRATATGTTTNTAMQLGDNPGGPDWADTTNATGHYHLVENRQRTPGSYDESLPGAGLLILEIDESFNDNTTNKLVRVAEANGDDLIAWRNAGDAGDVWSGPGPTYYDDTVRSSVGDIGASGDTMFATFTGPPGVAPANDGVAGATSLTGWSASARNQSTAFATTGRAEPAQPGCPMGGTRWYRYTPVATGYLDVSLAGSDAPGSVNVWRGTSFLASTAAGCSTSDDLNGVVPAVSRIPVTASQPVYLQIGGRIGAGGKQFWGELDLRLTLRPANDDFARALDVTSGASAHHIFTGNATIERGEPRDVRCPAVKTSVWYRYRPTHDSTLRVTTAGSDFDTVVAVWAGAERAGLTPVACNDDVSLADRTSAVSGVRLQAGQTYFIQAGGYSVGGALSVSTTIRPDNDDFANATVLVGPRGTDTSTTTDATFQVGEPNHAGHASGHSVWWSWTASHDGPVSFDTEGSTGDTVLAAYVGSTVDGLATLASNDDAIPTVRWSRVTFDAVAGQTYRIAVDHYNATTGEVRLSYHESTDLQVRIDPRDRPDETVFGYEITASREGGDDPADVVVMVELPPTVVLQDLPPTCDVGSGLNLRCNLGAIPRGERAAVDILVRPTSEGPHSATATIATPDDDPEHNTWTGTASEAFVCDNDLTAGADNVVGTDGNDILCGGAGDDVLRGGPGDDLLLGGVGTDTIDYGLASAAMNVDLRNQGVVQPLAVPAASGPADGTDLGLAVERVRGTAYADRIVGDDRSNVLDGRGGADVVEGLGRADKLYGGNGIDTLSGGAGADTIYGGKGIDTIDGGPDVDTCLEAEDVRTACEA